MNYVFRHNIFPNNYKVFHADRVYNNVTLGCVALIRVLSFLCKEQVQFRIY
jgi:hypothetical protein